jgi:hypothetical protein
MLSREKLGKLEKEKHLDTLVRFVGGWPVFSADKQELKKPDNRPERTSSVQSRHVGHPLR